MIRVTGGLQHIITYLAATTGIQLPETLHGPVEEFVHARCQEKGLSVEQYVAVLEEDPHEYSRFIDSVTVNETYFFREEVQFKALEREILPALANTNRGIKVWSSSCSSGEEAVSLYCLARRILGGHQLSMYATDINQPVLELFRRGLYKKNSFRQDGSSYRHMVEECGESQGDSLLLGSDVLSQINIVQLNLNTLPTEELPDDFDIIFLRNTIIYFNIEERERIINGIVRHLREGGMLFTSITEVALVANPELTVDSSGSVYFFRKKTIDEKKQGTVISRPLIEQIVHDKPPVPAPAASEPDVPEPVVFSTDMLDVESILSMANQKLNNPLFHLPANRAYRTALELMEVLYLLDREDITESEKLINRIESIVNEEQLAFYLRGLLHQHRQEPHTALDFYSEALSLDAELWPARYNRAMLYLNRQRKDEALEDFIQTEASISRYINDGEYLYQVFMDGFNGKYFQTICSKWIEKLEQTGQDHGTG